jgi:hypothetical protein
MSQDTEPLTIATPQRPGGGIQPTAAASGGSPFQADYRRRPDPMFHWVILGLSGAVLALACILSVREQTRVVLPIIGQPLPELCLMKRMTGGLGCPGCGMTRCFISLAHGDVARAWSYNPAGLWFFGIVLFQIPYRGIQLWRIRRGQRELVTGWLAQIAFGILAVAMIGQWILRLCGVAI